MSSYKRLELTIPVLVAPKLLFEFPILASLELVIGLLVLAVVIAFELVLGRLVVAKAIVVLKLAPDVGVLVHCIINKDK